MINRFLIVVQVIQSSFFKIKIFVLIVLEFYVIRKSKQHLKQLAGICYYNFQLLQNVGDFIPSYVKVP